MKPARDRDAVVDLLDVALRDGVVVEADVVIGVADVPLVGISLRAAIAGMTTMTEYGVFEEDRARRGISARAPSSDWDGNENGDSNRNGDGIDAGRPPVRNER